METVTHTENNLSGSDFDEVATAVRNTFAERFAEFGPNLFMTRSKGLSSIYVDTFPEDDRQHHNCNCCRDFIRKFGHAVIIKPSGEVISAMWDHTKMPDHYKASVKALEDTVVKNGVINRWYTFEKEWGKSQTNGWKHFSLPAPKYNGLVAENEVATFAGKNKEGFDLLTRALAENSIEVIRNGANLLNSEAVPNGERYRPQINWLFETAKTYANIPNPRNKRHRLFLAVADSHVSFPRIASTVVGTLLDDIRAGLDGEALVHRFNKLTAPEIYQRPVAAPSAGNVTVARKIFADLGLTEDDLARRFATIDEIQTLWKPTAAEAEAEKPKLLFGDIKTKEVITKPVVQDSIAPAVRMTYEKFLEKVLPSALAIDMYIPHGQVPNFSITAAVKPDAGRLFFYDLESKRNTFGWFANKPWPAPHQLNLRAGSWTNVLAITSPPAVWDNAPGSAIYRGASAILEGAWPTYDVNSCLFPELLRNDLHEARRVIAAYSDVQTTLEREGSSATGISFGSMDLTVRVTTALGRAEYVIDRFE